ncbi:MAG: type III polyketide synthase [Nitrospirota bacterium]|nr:type III polyketide synthase [Nitrospirota bacterium]
MVESTRAYIASVATAVPEYSADQQFAEEFMKKHYGPRLNRRSMGLISTVFSHPSIRKRHFAFDDPARLVQETPDERVARFTERSIELAVSAIRNALDKARVTVHDVRGLVVNTCTGYICPGIATYLVERLGLARDIRLYDLVGSGCGGAIPNLQVAESLLPRAPEGVVVSVSVEICSATFEMDNDLSLILSNALFGDGAAAAVLWTRPEGLEIAGTGAWYAPEHREAIRFVHKEGRLRNQLSLRLPELVAAAASAVSRDVLGHASVEAAAVSHWALHTGGEKILNAVRDELKIPEDRLWASRKVLGEYGNMSSPTVWFVLEEILKRGMGAGETCLMLAYGAGMSAHGALLRKK